VADGLDELESGVGWTEVGSWESGEGEMGCDFGMSGSLFLLNEDGLDELEHLPSELLVDDLVSESDFLLLGWVDSRACTLRRRLDGSNRFAIVVVGLTFRSVHLVDEAADDDLEVVLESGREEGSNVPVEIDDVLADDEILSG